MQDNELVYRTGPELAQLIRSRDVSPVEVVTAFLDRVEELNPQVNAFITITRDHALTRAGEAEREIRAGRYLGPLHGIPYAPKDILATKDILTSFTLPAKWFFEMTLPRRGRGSKVCRASSRNRSCDIAPAPTRIMFSGPYLFSK